MTSGSNAVSVRGGSAGIAAQCDAIRTLARRCGDLAEHVGAAAFRLHGYLLDPALGLAGLARVAEYVRFEAQLLATLDGPLGMTCAAAQLGLLDVQLRAAAELYADADSLGDEVHDVVAGMLTFPAALGGGAATFARTGDPISAAEAAVAADPAAADVVVDMLGVPHVLAELSAALPDGRPRVAANGVDEGPRAVRPPRSLGDIVGELADRDDGPHGAVDVRIITRPSGRRHVVVDITGTKTADLRPSADVTGLITDGKALVGARTTYENGVLIAMRRAGVRRDDAVMLVGHSEGGMVAVTVARDAMRSGEFTITHVVTAGAPIARTVAELPGSVEVLALENGRDVVPHLDGARNPDRTNVTTVVGDRGDGTLVGDHALRETYVPLAADADVTADRSVRDFVRSADGFLCGTHVETRTYVVTRHV
jgi:hypothetical protein